MQCTCGCVSGAAHVQGHQGQQPQDRGSGNRDGGQEGGQRERHKDIPAADGGNVCKDAGALRIVIWNVHGLLTGSRELALSNLLENSDVDVLVATETEIPATAAPFATTGYNTFFPLVRLRSGYGLT
jgi:hypothetical protein